MLALKALARSTWPADLKHADRPYPKCWYEPLTDPRMAGLALRFTLSLPVTAAVTPGDIRLFRLAVELAGDLRPLTVDELELLRQQDKSRQAIFTV